MKCIYIKEGGQQCNAYAMESSQYCYLHNPDISEEEKRVNQTKGGKTNLVKVTQSLQLFKVKTSQDVAGLLEQTINEVRSGELDPRIANTIGYLTGHLIKAIEVGEVERRINAIEEVISK